MSQQDEIKSGSHLKLPGKDLFSWKNLGRTLHSMLDGTFLTRTKFRRAMPFIIFLMILGVIYISNIFRVEKTKRNYLKHRVYGKYRLGKFAVRIL